MTVGDIILLTGAPPPWALGDDDASCCVDGFEEPFRLLLGLPAHTGEDRSASFPSPPRSQPAVAWRVLPPTRGDLEARDGDDGDDDDDRTPDFFSLARAHPPSYDDDVARDRSGDDLWTQFCDQLLADHAAAAPADGTLSGSRFFEDDSNYASETTSLMTTTTIKRLDLVRTRRTGDAADATGLPPVSIPLSNVNEVPSAKRILFLQPQTVSLKLVGVLAVASPRAVTTRWGRSLSLVEVPVGDHTACGFAVTFWLTPAACADDGCISRLRRQDVVLMENVGLHVFRGKVYGQSLRRGLTRVHLLWRRDRSGSYSTRQLDRLSHAAEHLQLRKARLTKDWVLHFVGQDSAPETIAMTRRRLRSWDKPPKDTQ